MGSSGSALILLPLLISGFLFNTIFYPFRYFASKAEGQKLFFMAAGSGTCIGALVFAICGAIASTKGFSDSWVGDATNFIDTTIPFEHAARFISTIVGAVVLGLFLNLLLKILYGRGNRSTAKEIYNRLTDVFGNPLWQLLRRATSEQRLVLLTLKSRKIYCGRILEVPLNIDANDAYLEILPSFSGYRDKDTLKFGSLKTEYPVIAVWEAQRYIASTKSMLDDYLSFVREHGYEGAGPSTLIADHRAQLEKEIAEAEKVLAGFGHLAAVDPSDWTKAIAISEVESASFFSPEAYEAWFSNSADSSNSSESN